MPLILLNKPYRVLCQFTDPEGRSTLADHVATSGVYPAGRLDYESEGLLLLTDDGALQDRISHPRRKLAKHYWVQVEGNASDSQLEELCTGVRLKDGIAKAESAMQIGAPDSLWPREPPVRERKTVADCWLDIALTQGRNRQVRRMTAAVGLPTLRLVRHRIGPWSLQDLAPGECRQISNEKAWDQIKSGARTPLR